MSQLPKYRCHKVVRAAKILALREVPDFGPVLDLEGGHERPCKVGWDEKIVGGYYVEYDDGYASWSPAKAFEEGYRRSSETDPNTIMGGG